VTARPRARAKADRLGTSDPFCAVRVEGHQRNTPTIKKTLDPEWNVSYSFKARYMTQPLVELYEGCMVVLKVSRCGIVSCSLKVADRTRAIVEVFCYDKDGGFKGDPLGKVSFPMGNLVRPGMLITNNFTLEPMRGMHQKVGELGELEMQLLFIPSEHQVEEDLPLESPAMTEMLQFAKDNAIPSDLLTLLREAAVILVARTVEELKAPDENPHNSFNYGPLWQEAHAEVD
jgi:hypothetical protein